jgi:NitT/TauT family transport system ATP-binding protein
MINNPKLMILDEPFRGLDVMTRGLMQEYYVSLFAETRMTTLFITSELEEALVVGERVLVMGGTPTRIQHSIAIDLPYPRTPEVLASDRYLAIKKQLMSALYSPEYQTGAENA